MGTDGTGHHKGNSTERLLDKGAILEAVNIQPEFIILDVGCGDGYMSREFSKFLGDGGRVYAMDRAEEAVEKLKEENIEKKVIPLAGDITGKTKFEESSFDLIYLSTVLHGFSEDGKKGFVQEIKRILKPGGRLALVEIEKRETPFGPPQKMRISPDEMRELIDLKSLKTVKAGEFFYLQVFEKGV